MGCSIWIFWPDEKQWFEGTVSASTGRKHQVMSCRHSRSDGSSWACFGNVSSDLARGQA